MSEIKIGQEVIVHWNGQEFSGIYVKPQGGYLEVKIDESKTLLVVPGLVRARG